MTVSPAPITQKVIDEGGLPTLAWTLFFNQNYNGDPGTSWDPVITGLTGSTSSVTGRFYRISQYLVFFTIDIQPSTATTSNAGSTYVGNFPLTFKSDGFNTVVSGSGGGAIGMNQESQQRIYLPGWTSVSNKLKILGFVEAT